MGEKICLEDFRFININTEKMCTQHLFTTEGFRFMILWVYCLSKLPVGVLGIYYFFFFLGNDSAYNIKDYKLQTA